MGPDRDRPSRAHRMRRCSARRQPHGTSLASATSTAMAEATSCSATSTAPWRHGRAMRWDSLFQPCRSASPGSQWHEAGSGDLNRDGRSDILWRDDGGTAVEWLMNGAEVLSAKTLGTAPTSCEVGVHHFD